MIQLEHISLQRGTKPLLQDADLVLHPGQRAALVGVNGSGKTSLMALLLGELEADGGECTLPERSAIAHMQQEISDPERPAREYILDGHKTLRRLQQAINKAEQEKAFDKLGQLHAELDAIDGYSQQHRAEAIMLGLGFCVADYDKPVAAFSGGWRIRLNLARALLTPSEVLLLDEPTNHLDMEAIHWLEQWLAQYPGSVLLISHDRDFIDATVQRIFHIHHHRIDTYNGNYSAFERQRAENLAQQQSLYEKQQQRRQELQQFIDRFRAKATKAKQAQSRIKALEKMQAVSPVREPDSYHFSIPEAKKSASPLINWFDVTVGYGSTPVLEHCTFSVIPGMRLALLGVNGAGKSTLIKTLAGEVPALSGEVTVSEFCRIGYFAQHQLEALDVNASPLLHLQRLSPDVREQEIRDFLGSFRIVGDMAVNPVMPFSGGEKARLALAIIAWQKPNLLLLDEPTNHLDLEMREALAEALQNFKGAVILVSHDRYLLRHCVDDFALVSNGRFGAFDGDLDDYYRFVQDSKPVSDNSSSNDNPASKKQQRQDAAKRRQQLAPLKKNVKSLETKISNLENALANVEQQLADSALYEEDSKDKLNTLLETQGKQRNELETLEQQWFEEQEKLIALEEE